MPFDLHNPQRVILEEIENKVFKQKDIALTLAFCIRQRERDNIDFPKISKAIMERWSPSGLERILRMAWKHIEDNAEGEADD